MGKGCKQASKETAHYVKNSKFPIIKEMQTKIT